jgi:glutathione S-transferase
MVLKIYGHSFSTCTRTVEVVLEEKKVPYEVIAVNVLKGEHKQAEYLEKHPFGVIPYIVGPTR